MPQRGRPRNFDREAALRQAMLLFWLRGYEGTSLGELTEAMGINKPSLYAAFGCKEALFREAVAYYESIWGEPIGRAFEEAPTAREAMEAALRRNVDAYADPDCPPGCMVVLSALPDGEQSDESCDLLKERRKAGRDLMRHRIERGMAEGDVPSGTDAEAVATFYTTVLQGLSIQARDGASPQAMHAIVDSAMAGWDNVVAAMRQG